MIAQKTEVFELIALVQREILLGFFHAAIFVYAPFFLRLTNFLRVMSKF